MIVTRALTKRYGAVEAVRAVDLDVRAGDRYGLLGPNGSGKTTLVRMMLLFDAAGPHGRAGRRTRRRRIDRTLEQVGLAGVGRRPVKAYSLGMRQRLGLAAALLGEPRLLVLDEPGHGLDPRGIADLRELIIGLNETGVTVFLSSHLLAEVEQLCTRVGVLDSGRLVLQEDLAALQAPTGRVMLDTPEPTGSARCSTGRWSSETGRGC